MCPTRGRPEVFRHLASSMARTTERAQLVAYIDEDDPLADEYRTQVPRVEFVRGPRIGPVAACNHIAAEYDYDVCGMVPDDAEFVTLGWDRYVDIMARKFKNQVGVISPHHNLGTHVDMPFVTRQWVEATGWFAYPKNFHWCWPTITSLLGEMTAIVHAPGDRFHIHHKGIKDSVPAELTEQDFREFYWFIALENNIHRLPITLQKLREAIG